MSKKLKRDFKVREKVYVVDYWGTSNGSKAFSAEAVILRVDKQARTFHACLYGDTYQAYSFEDYGRLIFDTEKEAIEAANKLPTPKSLVYQKIGKRVYKKIVRGISGNHFDGVYDLIIRLNRGKAVSTKEIGISIFLNEVDARK